MKNFLAVDTCGKHLAVLARKGEKTSRFFLPDCAMRHSVLLMDGIDEALRGADLSPGECDFFAVATGPGSFTGIRIGISAVKGFCLAAGKPALPVTAFEEMAYNGVDGEKRLCLIDALHGHFYAAAYALVQREGAPALEELLAPAYLSGEEVSRFLKESGCRAYSFGALPLPDGMAAEACDPLSGLEQAVEAALKAGRFASPEALYIRRSQAEEQLGRA